MNGLPSVRMLARLVCLSLLGYLSFVSTVAAQSNYPTHPIRLVVPQSTGSGADIVARLISHKVGATIGQTIVVENRPGANGVVATAAVAKAAPDGYTLLLTGVSQMSFNPKLYKTLPYTPEKDFTYISPIVNTPFVLVTGKNSRYSSLRQLIATAKSAPVSITYASAGHGNSTHLSTEMVATATGIKLHHIPYKGSGPALNAVIGGEIDLMTSVVGSALAHIQGGNLIPLVVLADARVADLPDVPTLKEAGVEAPTMPGWFAVVGPTGLDPEIVRKLNAAFQTAVNDPEIGKKLKDLYFVPFQGSGEQMRAKAAEDAEVWGAFITQAGIQID